MANLNNNDAFRRVMNIIGTLILIAFTVFICIFLCSRFFNFSFDFLPFGKANLIVVDNSLKESVDAYDLQGRIITGRVKNTSKVTVDEAIVTVYFSDASGIDYPLETTRIYNIEGKCSTEFKVRIDRFAVELMQKYGVSKIWAEVSW